MSAGVSRRTEKVNKLQSMLECPECNQMYTDPQQLSCQHTVCKGCLSNIKVKLKQMVKCPICEETCALGDIKKDKNMDELVSVCRLRAEDEEFDSGSEYNYRADTKTVRPVPKLNLATDQSQQSSCDICHQEIAWFCNQCKQWLCDECQVRHSKVNSTKHHQCDTAEELAKQQQTILQKHLDTIQQAVHRLESVFKQIENEIDNTKSLGKAALKESSNIREDWLEKVNQHFDTLDVRIAEFIAERTETLHRIKQRIELSFAELNEKIKSLHEFMSQPASAVVSRARDVVKDCVTYINETQVPRVEFKHTVISVTRGTRWDHENAASLEMHGGHNVYSLPVHQKWPRSQSKSKAWKSAPSLPGSTGATPRKSVNHKGAGGRSSKATPGPRPTPIAHAECFKMLTKGKFRVHAKAQLKVKPVSIHYIRDKIWCALGNEIRAWTTDLTPVHFDELDAPRIKHDLLREVQALAELKSGQIAVASGSGLHLLTKTGRYDGRIVDEVYTDVCFANERLYAAMFGLHSRAKLQVFDEEQPWQVQGVITLPCDGYVTVNVQESVIYVCSATHGVIYVTKHDGEAIKKIGLKRVRGDLGQFNEPRICHGDLFGAILISDRENECLQIWGMSEEWEFVNLEKKVQKPGCAVFVKKQLFILQTEAPFRLLKYI